MKKFYFLSIISYLSIISCSKEENKEVDSTPHRIVEVRYDTTAIDSFGPGAQDINIVQNIKMASVAYRDSIAEVIRLEEERKRLKEDHLIKEELKKKEDQAKKEKEKETTTTTPNTTGVTE